MYLNMSEIPFKSVLRNEGVLFLEFMNTKDFSFMKSALSITLFWTKKTLLFERTPQSPLALYYGTYSGYLTELKK